MEHLEVNLTSLEIICRHVDKSHSQIHRYLPKQIWNQQDRQSILEILAHLLIEKDYTLLVARHVRPLILDLLVRNVAKIKAGGGFHHDFHERFCVALSKLLSISPDAHVFAARYFSGAPPVFQRLFFTSEESSAVCYGPQRMKLRDLMGATLRFLEADCSTFGPLWDWSPCVPLLRSSDVVVRGCTAQCLALVSHMTDSQKTSFLKKVLTSEEILHLKLKTLEETQLMGTEKALVLVNPAAVAWHQTSTQNYTRHQVVSKDLCPNVVAVCGVVLPKPAPLEADQLKPSDLVLVDSTSRNLRRLALAVASQNAVLLEGPIGCGKTALVEFMAATTGHTEAAKVLKVQLGDQTDSKMLLGMYRCTDVPGKFEWQPGTLTQAVSKGHWILLEDIDHAPLDVVSVLLPLMENKKLMIPGREDCLDVAPGFQFFATRRMYYSGGGWHRPLNSHAALLDKYWTKLQMSNMTRAELKKVLDRRFPVLTVVSDRLLDIYCQLTGDKHSQLDTTTPQNLDHSLQEDSEDYSSPLEGRGLSLRDLLKWCERITDSFDSTSASTAQRVFQEALDCFTAMLSSPGGRLRMAEVIGSKLNISKEKARHFHQMYQPAVLLTELQASVGRVALTRKPSETAQLMVEKQTFATTRPSAVLLEQLAVCVAKGEPVLLVGETGTGKTSTVQHLATVTGNRLRVVNMNQQSDTADLLGGYKPVDCRQILLPLREVFEDLFSQTFSRKQNLTFLGHVQTCFREKRWQDLLGLMNHVCRSALAKELKDKSNAATLREQWETLALKLTQTQQQMQVCERTMLFAFVEGTLAQAVRKGHWVLLDEINLAAAETLECLSGLLEGRAGSLVLLDRGDTEPLVRHPDFRLFACMNPATDVGKRNLPLGLRNRFTELFVQELESEADLRILVSDYLKSLNPQRSIISGIISFYLAVRKEAVCHLMNGTGHRPHYSLRTLCRALKYAAADPCCSVQRSLYEPIPAPPGRLCIQMEGYWVPQGEMEPHPDPSYILTPSVKLNLHDLARVVSAGTHPVLIQGETSVGKTSLIRWLAAATGNRCVRINNHEHTDIQEYIGCYSSDERGKLVFNEGVLIDAMKKGYWIILDELNLAPTDVLEALNRLLDDNRELFVAETQEVIKAHPRFMLFATQNPPGLYGGRKVLSRAFRNRFVELHFDELPSGELETILHQRCSLPPSYCTKLVRVMLDLQSLRRGSSVFAGKHGFITLRDLFRWAERYRLEEQTQASQDWLQHLADDGFMLLAARVRKPEEEDTIRAVLQKHFKRAVDPESLFSLKRVSSQFSSRIDSVADVPEEFRHVVWTGAMRRLAVLVGRALRFGESVLLVGDTGCGKTTICQLFAALAGRKFFSVNCHLNMETSDFLGGLRPVRHAQQMEEEDVRLFEWHDGPLVLAMKEGGVFLMDEISLADDSVLERLNSVLETEKSLVLAEKGSGDDDDVELIRAAAGFHLVATMNPGGDFGKKELSPALRNRFTEVWCSQSNRRGDLLQIVQHNLGSGLSLGGGDVATVMLDFTQWLMQQDFGRRCILSVRDILSWVHFLNAVCRPAAGALGAAPEWDLRLDPVTAFIHAACLVYIDGIGSGTTASCSDDAASARQMCLDFLQQRLRKVTELDQSMMDALKVYDSSLPRQPRWGRGFFGIDPFYLALGPEQQSRGPTDYALTAGTTLVNVQRLLRALKLQRPVLLEGSPGVGKTSLVAALAKASGNHLVRINLSDQTDVSDLFGTDLPVEGGKGGQFAWRDGPLLAALKAGHWVVLDELNLASQSVLEGLNACFDHRAEIYIPELGMSFQVQHEKTKIFGCQNPFGQGGGRKGLPKSFLNRFTQVFVDQLSSKDMEHIVDEVFPRIDKKIISKMVEFSTRLVQEVCVERRWGHKGGPWEFNLRDLFRWCQLMQSDQSEGGFDPGQHVSLVYADRMRSVADKAKVLLVFREVFGQRYEPYCGSRHFQITPISVQVGFSVLRRDAGAPVSPDPQLSVTHQCLSPLESLMKCVQMGWMTILVGPTASGKTSLVRLLSLLTGHRLRVMGMNSSMDTTELLGGFEQLDIMRPWQQVLESTDHVVAMVMRQGLMSLDIQDTEFLLHTWGVFSHWLKERTLQRGGVTVTSEALDRLQVVLLLLQKLNTKLRVFTDLSKLQTDFLLLKKRVSQLEDSATNGSFEWLDGMLVQALQAGHWLLMDNVNFCSTSVLDRLNALLEPNGSLTIGERGVIDGKVPQIIPHPNFRLFLTMDPVHGELSRAMRNRGVEVYIPGEQEGVCWDLLDLKTLLHTAGVTGDCVCNLLIQIHNDIKSAIWDSPASSVASLLHAATLTSCQLQRGADLRSALRHACDEAYSTCQRTAAAQKQAQQLVEQHLSILDNKDGYGGLLCAGVWPDGVPSALLSVEDSCLSSVLRDGQVLSFCLNSLSLQGKRSRPLRLEDLQRALQGRAVHEDLVFCGGGVDVEGRDALSLIPTAVRLVTEKASHGDWVLRSSWLSHLGKSYRSAPDAALVQLEAGNSALKAIFSSKLAAKAKSLMGCLQSDGADEFRTLLDMRWNQQYLEILANKCSFKNDEGYSEFVEVMNAVANRITLMINRKERAVICSGSISMVPQNSALSVATAFSRGTTDMSHLPHPVLMHLRTFFDLWEEFVLQAVQTEERRIPDPILFEILELLQWCDRLWDVSSVLPADSHSVPVLSLHWQWVQKHLLLHLPQLLLENPAHFQGHQELQAVSAAVQGVLCSPPSLASALKGIQKRLGKVLPFKLESVAGCAARLRLLSQALDVNHVVMDGSSGRRRLELIGLQAAGLGSDIKQNLLKGWSLVRVANNQLDPQLTGVLQELLSAVETQQSLLTSKGLLEVCSRPEEEDEAAGGIPVIRGELLQLWPLMEELAVLNQLRLTSDLLLQALSPGDQEAEAFLHQQLSRHLSFCLQNTPVNAELLRSLFFLQGSEQLSEDTTSVWCELLAETLTALWTCSVSSDPDRWLRWDPSGPEPRPGPKLSSGLNNMGPAMLTKAVWSHCMLGVLSSGGAGGRGPEEESVFSLSHVGLGAWKERVLQLQDVSAVLWDNMAAPALVEFRATDLRLQGMVLLLQLQSMTNLLPSNLEESYLKSCRSLVDDANPQIAAEEIQTVLRDALPPGLLPEDLLGLLLTCLHQYIQGRVQGSDPLVCSGVFWVNMGIMQIKLWTPQTIFDPTVKRAYKLDYAKQELALLKEEWKARNMSSLLLTGLELKMADSFQHPRIRYLWSRMQQLTEQIQELSRKQAFRPRESQYGRLFQDLQHYLGSIGQVSTIKELLSHMLKVLQDSSSARSKAAVRALLKEEAVWQNSQQRFCQKLLEDYPLYPDVVSPIRTGILQLQHGMKLVSSQVVASLTPVPGLSQLASCLLAFPSVSPSLPSYLARADFLCSRTCMDILSLVELLPKQDSGRVIPQTSTLLVNALLYVQSNSLSTGVLSPEACSLFRHICQALVNEWDEQERRERERELVEASLYRSRLHGSGLTEDEQEEKDFRLHFPHFNKDFADLQTQMSLEGPADTEQNLNEDSPHGAAEVGCLSWSAMNTVVQVHQLMCLGYARSLWYQNTAPANQSKGHIQALLLSYQIACPMMSSIYRLIDSDVDQQLTGSGLLLSAILQNTVQSSSECDELAISSDGPYDFYHQPNMSQARLCVPVLEQLSVAVGHRLEEWPEHPALVQLTQVVERILAFSLTSPLAKFLNGLEILLSKAQDWENNASRSVSLRRELEPVTQLIIQWRQLELSCWSNSLDNTMKRHMQKSIKHWFSIYQLLEKYLEGERAEPNPDGGVERLSLSSVSSTLQAFMEGSTVGEFDTRLRMLLSFHCHLLLVPSQPGRDVSAVNHFLLGDVPVPVPTESLSSVLWNLHKYYSQFSNSIQARVTQLREPIEKELKDFVKISKWNDVSFWSIKQSVEKTHRTLFKFVKKFDEALSCPSLPSLVEPGGGVDVDVNPEYSPVQRIHRALKNILSGGERALQTEPPAEGVHASPLQARLPALARRMKKICVQMLKKDLLPELTEDLDYFTGKVVSSLQDLQSLSVDRTADKDKQKSEVKHIQQQKKRALSDLFKMLSNTGLSYRKGLMWSRTTDPESPLLVQPLELSAALCAVKNQHQDESSLFTEVRTAWDGCQKYFYRSWARRTALQTALQHSAKEVGVGTIDRCRGFTSHLFKLLLKQRTCLARLTDQWVSLRSLTDDIQQIRVQLQTQSEDAGCTLPPQDSLQDWVRTGQGLAAQCATLLQQLVWLLLCCPASPQLRAEVCPSTLRHPSPLAPRCQPPGCLLRRGDAAWCQLHQLVAAMLKHCQSLQEELASVIQQASGGVLLAWSSFSVCSSAMEQLADVAGQMSSIEQLFTTASSVGGTNYQPAVTQSLRYVRGQVEAGVTEFTAWKTQLLFLDQPPSDQQSSFCRRFSAELETNINKVLCAVQKLVKRRERELPTEQHGDPELIQEGEEEGGEESVVDLLKPGHLTQLLEEDLEADMKSLSVGDVTAGLGGLLSLLRSYRDSSQPPQLQEVNQACRMLVRLHPLLGVYSDLVLYFLTASLGVHRSTGKLLSVLASIFTELAQKGFCLPPELVDGSDGDGASEFHDYQSGGIGEGEGAKDVSDKIENEDQVEDTHHEGQEKEEQQDGENIKSEDNAIEMSEDFDGQMHDGDEAGENEEESDKEEEEELDKKMGDLGDGQTDTLDERLWGDDEDDGGGSGEEEEESGQGMDQGESQLAAKDDQLHQGESNEDKNNQDKDEDMCEEEEEEKIHEQGDKREFDENEVDPYHGEQDKRPEPEAMELPQDLNLDQDEEAGDDEEDEVDGENSSEADDKSMNPDMMEKEQKEGEGEEERGEGEQREEDMEENQAQEENNQEYNMEEESVDKEDEEKEKEEEREGERGKEEDVSVPNYKGEEPQEEAEGEEREEEEEPNSAERKDHSRNAQVGDENVQSDSAVELAGEPSEKDQAKEEYGSGAADASQSEGHQSKLTARMASQTQTKSKTQSMKRKPGRADNERLMGDHSKQVNKRLRMVDSGKEPTEDKQGEGQQDSDLYEYIKEGSASYDTQTYDVATAEQQQAAGPEQGQNEDDEDAAMETEDQEEDFQPADVQELKPDQLGTSSKASRQDGGETPEQRRGEEDKDTSRDPRLKDEEEPVERRTGSTIHTHPALLLETMQKADSNPEEMRKEMELQLEAWNHLPPGTQEEESAAASLWHQYQALTSTLSQQLCEQIRLVLEPTQATKLKGDYRTGKRLNMRKVIPYIASNFHKDKIWLRRTKPSKREYQICLAVDDSSSMMDNHSKQLAFESLSVIINALTLLEVGQVAVCSFGEQVQLLHPLQQQFSDESGARILRLCQFQQKKTRIAQFLETSTKMFLSARQQSPGSVSSEAAQLLFIVSDGRGLFLEGQERVGAAVQAARTANIFVIFVVLDNPNSRDSILDIKVPIFREPGQLPEIRSYMDEFPFPFYIILRDVSALPETLSDALRQWFELVTTADQ
ncbi:midasin isoform X3 [Nothobranchius furzeri]|uniref:midasin isoform X3 n=1 Tax=Nothobranchius furzeri TaxID=105023 RepID=UPI0039048BA1